MKEIQEAAMCDVKRIFAAWPPQFTDANELYTAASAMRAILRSQIDSSETTTEEIRDRSFEFLSAAFRLVIEPDERRCLCDKMTDFVICAT